MIQSFVNEVVTTSTFWSLYGLVLLWGYTIWSTPVLLTKLLACYVKNFNNRNVIRSNESLYEHSKSLGLFLVCVYNFFQKYFQNIFSCQNWAKTRNFLKKNQNIFFQNWNMLSRLFWRESSDNLRHSVLSSKRFGKLEMKSEQKARPSRDPGFRGVRGYLNGLSKFILGL